MKNFVYLTTNLVTKKQYIGDHSANDLNDEYIGSGIYLKKVIKKYGKENFEKQILEFFPTKQEAFNAQEKYIKQYNTLIPNGYNISPKGGHQSKNSLSEETKLKISKSHKGIGLGVKRSEKTKEKMRLKLIGNTYGLGKIRSKESKEKYSKSKIGILNPMYGSYREKNPRFDFTIYRFKNIQTGEIFEGYKFDLAKKLNNISSSIIRIINRTRNHYKNWVFEKIIN